MHNGCVCCTVRGDLINILLKLKKRSANLDAIIIETTGMADPAPVAQTFFVDDEVRRSIALHLREWHGRDAIGRSLHVMPSPHWCPPRLRHLRIDPVK